MAIITTDKTNDDIARTLPSARGQRNVALRLSTVVLALGLALFVIATVVFAGLFWSSKGNLADRDTLTADNKHAEQIALDYAVGASTINYQDLPSWFTRLKVNTTPELANKFDATAPQLEQILVPLQWTSTATPIVAVVKSESGGIFHVSSFANVTSTSAQTPKGSQITVTYSVTIDRNANWAITEVGGMGDALGIK